MKNKKPLLVWAVIALAITVCALNFILTIVAFGYITERGHDFAEKVRSDYANKQIDIESNKQKIDELQKRIENIETAQPESTVGQKGDKGDKGDKGESGESIKGEDGAKGDKGDDGLTPEIRCNIIKNRWEVRYKEDFAWSVIQPIAKCTVTRSDILDVLVGE